MKLSSTILIIYFTVFIFGCRNDKNLNDKKSDTINNDSVYIDNANAAEYLNSLNFVYKSQDTLIVIPTIGCGGCSESTLKWLSSSINRSNNYKVIIDGNDIKKYNHYPFFHNIFFDKNNIMSNYRFGIGYPHMLIINKEIISVIPYSIYDSNVFNLK